MTKFKIQSVICFLGLFIFTGCSGLFYYPDRYLHHPPEARGLKYVDHFIPLAGGGEIHGWLFEARLRPGQKKEGIVVMFHGNAENLSSHYLSLAWLIDYGYDFFIFDYRGYGRSPGSPDQLGLRQDGLAVLKFSWEELFQKRLNGKGTFAVYGQSLGGIVAADSIIHSPLKNNINKLVLDSTFSSYQNIANQKLQKSWMTYLLSPLAYVLVRDKTAVDKKLGQLVPVSILVTHGTLDEVVEINHGKYIYEAYSGRKQWLPVDGAGHTHIYHGPYISYRDKLITFLSEK